MNRSFLIAAASLFIAGPAAAEVVHQSAVAHDGTTLSVSYEPRTTTRLRQGGLGQKLSPTCLWKAELSVERKLLDASGRPVEALTRRVGEVTTAEGLQHGYCADLAPHRVAVFQGNPEKMRAFLAEASASDRQKLHAELASTGSLVGSLGRAGSR